MISRSVSSPVPADVVDAITAPLPKTLWIELTSKCPFDCVFCSRRGERGDGEHMAFALFEALIGQLDRPEVIRLNYSGESMNYPQLGEAIRLARATGATTELVSALGSAPQSALESAVEAGLHRLSVSLHATEQTKFREIYGNGDVAGVFRRVEFLEQYKKARGTRYPEIDFAFVAMEHNLDQLLPVAAYAAAHRARQLSIHPVIRRGAAPREFPVELDAIGGLRANFSRALEQRVAEARAASGGMAITIARPMETCDKTAGLATCEQNPWETIHVLANGDVVVCEVQDRTVIGSLANATLQEIWQGERYREFREQYANGGHAGCAGCPWKRSLSLDATALVRGWHGAVALQPGAARWTEGSAAALVPMDSGAEGIRVRGLLPVGNTLAIRNGVPEPFTLVNRETAMLPFDVVIPKPRGHEAAEVVRIESDKRFCPAEQGTGTDLRQLGVAITGLSAYYGEKRAKQTRRFLHWLERAGEVGARWPGFFRSRLPATKEPDTGIGVLIPARDTPELLVPTLATALVALGRCGEAGEITVVVSGANARDYEALRRAFPGVGWIIHGAPLSYLAAVRMGLAATHRPWVYLLNSDMRLETNALRALLPWRDEDVFAIGSRICMEDGSTTETNWTGLRAVEGGPVELSERDPAGLDGAVDSLYAGGGSGLFRTALLRRFAARCRAYEPFYWEDAEWGAMAWRYGFRSLFVPASQAVHGHRQTVKLFYGDRDVSRIFERNRLLFQLRNLREIGQLEDNLATLDARSWGEITRPAVLVESLRQRLATQAAPVAEQILFTAGKTEPATDRLRT